MAKMDDVNFVERHVEKLVLAGAAVVLLLTAALVFLRPTTIELERVLGQGATPQRPNEVDATLARMSETLRTRISEYEPRPYPVPNVAGEFEWAFDNPAPGVDSYLVWSPPNRRVTVSDQPVRPDPGDETIALKALLPLVAPQAPAVAPIRSVKAAPADDPSAVGPVPTEVSVAHGAAVYDLAEQRAALDKAFEPLGIQPRVTVVAVEVQRRSLQGEGQWSAPETISVVRAGQPLPPLPPVRDDNLDQVRDAVAQLNRQQDLVLQPDYWEVLGQAGQYREWIYDKPATEVHDPSKLDQPVGRSIPRPPREAPRRREPGARPGIRTPREEPGMLEPGARRGIRTPRRPNTPRDRSRSPVRRGDPGGVGRRPAVPAPAGPADQPGEQPPPTFAQQWDQGLVEVRFHDEGLADGQTYQYRLRLIVANPLLGRYDIAKERSAAEKLTLASPWSGWSESVRLRRPVEFFVVGGGAMGEAQVVVEVFTKKWGQWVHRRFTVRRGQPIGQKQQVEVTMPGGELASEQVDFSTGAVAVDFSFDHKRPNPAQPSLMVNRIELLYLDDDRKLRTKVQADEGSGRYGELSRQVVATR